MAKRTAKSKTKEVKHYQVNIGCNVGAKRFEPGDKIKPGDITEAEAQTLQKDFVPPVIRPVHV